MPFERARLVFFGLLSLVMAAGSIWMLVSGTGWHDKAWGAIGVLFFGLGGLMVLRSATKDEASLMRQFRTPRRTHPFIIPVALLFSLSWSQKLWICVPLLVAWALLFPRYEDKRALRAACVLAAVIAVGQAILALMATRGSDPADGLWMLVPQVVFSGMVLLLDVRVLWGGIHAVRPPAAAGGPPLVQPVTASFSCRAGVTLTHTRRGGSRTPLPSDPAQGGCDDLGRAGGCALAVGNHKPLGLPPDHRSSCSARTLA
ncbi:MAG: hypothetical protein M3Y55_09480 [Pseudomonadota bacterium]|nr:hypothetical protein [Pseudomonadota bacterium]